MLNNFEFIETKTLEVEVGVDQVVMHPALNKNQKGIGTVRTTSSKS